MTLPWGWRETQRIGEGGTRLPRVMARKCVECVGKASELARHDYIKSLVAGGGGAFARALRITPTLHKAATPSLAP